MAKITATGQKKKSKPGHKDKTETKQDLLKDLDRFAGSSEEDDDDDDDDDDYEQVEPSVDTDDESFDESNDDFDEGASSDEREESGNEDNDDDSSDDDEYGVPFVATNSTVTAPGKKCKKSDSESNSGSSSDNDDPATENSQNGMAGAMARILGLSAATQKKPTEPKSSVILSKTITPLQKQQKKEKEGEDALRQKRKQRREVNLTALHIPLSAATSRPIAGKDSDSSIVAKAMAREIEVESMHRRVATRGVVALFNAITQHQQQKSQQQADVSTKSKKNIDIKSMSKHGFLDMLKKTSSTSKDPTSKQESNSKENNASNQNKKNSKGWNALKDDFLMNKKLKDWDKALSGDEESDAEYDGGKERANYQDDDV
eukprot:CAMPEP_0176498630 /NCGR_PEP_ID=MMETSP0200_2-20121128/12436_1 /TAXON_ID=947934 /ORGANISM="Chaetoceros sp., Strain GSL56" /LENGTH=372 /DNA_ID=CAMNT_0017896875 /DNA_START=28 /DNA_END=1142 /DNA_ORIENTATION=-